MFCRLMFFHFYNIQHYVVQCYVIWRWFNVIFLTLCCLTLSFDVSSFDVLTLYHHLTPAVSTLPLVGGWPEGSDELLLRFPFFRQFDFRQLDLTLRLWRSLAFAGGTPWATCATRCWRPALGPSPFSSSWTTKSSSKIRGQRYDHLLGDFRHHFSAEK
jgi:hypothetical protein